MKVNPTQNTTKLGTNLIFEVYDFRNNKGFPRGQAGLVFEHRENRIVYCKYTRAPIQRNHRYFIRHNPSGTWQVDQLERFGPAVAVYGVDGKSTWDTNHEAAAALETYLEELRTESSLGSR